LIGRKLSSTDQMLLEVISAAVSVLGGHEKVHLAHLVPHRERAGMFKFVACICTFVHAKCLVVKLEDSTHQIMWQGELVTAC
jgi:hypothetical protein